MLQGYAFMANLVYDERKLINPGIFKDKTFLPDVEGLFRFDARINQKGLVIYAESKYRHNVKYEFVLTQSKIEEFAKNNDEHNKEFKLNEAQLKLVIKMLLEKNALLKNNSTSIQFNKK